MSRSAFGSRALGASAALKGSQTDAAAGAEPQATVRVRRPSGRIPRRLFIASGLSGMLVACGGGGGGGGGSGSGTPPPSTDRLVGDIFASPAEIATAEIRSTVGYAGDPAVSRAIRDSGRQVILDLLFVTVADPNLGLRVAPDIEDRLQAYRRDQADLLTAGVRGLVIDELFLASPARVDDPAWLASQLEVLVRVVDAVRRVLPEVRIGVSFSPYAAIANAAVLDPIAAAIAKLDWVATDPYWLGVPGTIDTLTAWTRDFVSLARAARPGIETWLVAQAFRLTAWDADRFRTFIAAQLALAPNYDHLIFFGWQATQELDPAAAGRHFDAETKALYAAYLIG